MPQEPVPYRPPALRFDGPGLTLLDAIRLTLQNDPTIKLRETDFALQTGVLRSQKGLFDSIFTAKLTSSRTQSELLDSEKADLQKKRDDLRTAVTEVTRLSDSLLEAGRILQDRNQAFNNPGAFNLSNIKDQEVLNQMQLLQSELILYRDILASPNLTDPTVRQDIINLREQTVGKNIDAFRAQQASIADAPRQLQTQLDNLGPTPTERWIKQNQLTFDLTKLFRSGISVRPFGDLRYSSQNFVGKNRTSVEFGGEGIEPVSNGKLGFDVVLPLARGRGRDSVAAAEIAAGFDLEASRLALLFQHSASVEATIQAYWQARAATDQVEILRRSVEIQGELGTITRALIAANEKPRSDEARILGSTADARSRYESAQRQLNEARINLAQVMGVALADALSIPLASDPYPQPPAGLQIDSQAYATFIRDAVNRRFDRQAALKSEASGKALAEGARRDKRPVFDTTLTGFGTSVKQSSLGYPSWVFRSGSVGLNLEKPFGNNSLAGIYDARLASLHQTQIASANLERQISLSVVQLSESLKLAVDRLRSSAEAVRNYDQTIIDEQARFRTGDSSLLDTILTEQQATSARLAYTAAQQEYASLLAALRQQAGLLVQDGNVDVTQAVTVPPALIGR